MTIIAIVDVKIHFLIIIIAIMIINSRRFPVNNSYIGDRNENFHCYYYC
jgi:hypothetical protein